MWSPRKTTEAPSLSSQFDGRVNRRDRRPTRANNATYHGPFGVPVALHPPDSPASSEALYLSVASLSDPVSDSGSRPVSSSVVPVSVLPVSGPGPLAAPVSAPRWPVSAAGEAVSIIIVWMEAGASSMNPIINPMAASSLTIRFSTRPSGYHGWSGMLRFNRTVTHTQSPMHASVSHSAARGCPRAIRPSSMMLVAPLAIL